MNKSLNPPTRWPQILRHRMSPCSSRVPGIGDGPVSRVRCGPVPIHAPTPRRATISEGVAGWDHRIRSLSPFVGVVRLDGAGGLDRLESGVVPAAAGRDTRCELLASGPVKGRHGDLRGRVTSRATDAERSGPRADACSAAPSDAGGGGGHRLTGRPRNEPCCTDRDGNGIPPFPKR